MIEDDERMLLNHPIMDLDDMPEMFKDSFSFIVYSQKRFITDCRIELKYIN
jgi:hypothetical protein